MNLCAIQIFFCLFIFISICFVFICLWSIKMDEYEKQWLARQIDALQTQLENCLTDDEREYAEQECRNYRQWLAQLQTQKDEP